jgi:hypothetical protein
MSLTIPNTFTSGTAVSASNVNSNFTAVAAKFGNIDNSDIKSAAGIDVDKLSAQYEYMTVPLAHVSNATFPAAGTVLAAAPVYNDGKGTWTAVAYGWYCQEVGSQDGAIDILWGYYETTGSLNGSPTTIANAEGINGGTNSTPFNDGAAVSVSLPWTVDRMMLYCTVDTQGTGVMSTAYDKLVVTVTLKRKIAT